MGIVMETAQVNVVATAYRRHIVDQEFVSEMEAPGEAFYTDTYHTIAINTMETEFGSIVEPIPITLKTYKPCTGNGHPVNGYRYPQPVIASTYSASPIFDAEYPATSVCFKNSTKVEVKDTPKVTRPPPKKKWIKEYLEEEPKSPVSVRVVTGVSVAANTNGIVTTTPVTVAPPCLSPAIEPVSAPIAPLPAPHLEFVQEHSRPRTISNSHGLPQIPSPPSVGSNGSGSGSNGSGSGSSGSVPRAGTREVHNKLEKNRRAHLKECFELLKRQLPATPDDKKTSNLSILGSAIRYINVLRRKERECEHEMERLAREKIAAQQRLAALKREVTTVRASAPPASSAMPPRPRSPRSPRTSDPEEKGRHDSGVNNQTLGIPVSIKSSPPHAARMESPSPPHTLNLSNKLRTLPIQITPTTSQVVRTSYGARHHNTLTLTTLATPDSTANGLVTQTSITHPITTTTTLVHPAQIHLPLSQVVSGGGLVVGGATLQLLSAGGLRVLHAHPHHTQHPPHHINGVTENSRITTSKENGVTTPPPSSTEGSVVVGGLPLVVSPRAPPTAAHLLHTHTLTHKMVETQMVKSGTTPLTVSAQYLSATTIVNPVVVVSAASPPVHPAHSASAPST